MRIDTPTSVVVVGVVALPLLLLSFAAAASDAGAKRDASGGDPAPRASDARPPVRVKLGVKVPGKVESAYWSAGRDQAEAGAIQIVFPTLRSGQKQPEHPKTQVWLLKADGTVIPPTDPPRIFAVDNAGGTTESAVYAYSHAAAAQAIAVVVSIDGQLSVDPIAQPTE